MGTALTKVIFRYISSQRTLPSPPPLGTANQDGNRPPAFSVGRYVFSLPGQMDEIDENLSKEEELVKWVIAMVGFTYQVRNRFDLPLFVKVPLAPLYLAE